MPEEIRSGGTTRWLPPALVDLVTTGASRKARRLLGAYTGAVAVAGLVADYRSRREARSTYSVTVQASDDLYPELHRWLLAQSQQAEHRSLLVESGNRHELISPDSPRDERRLKVALSTGQSAEVMIGGHPVRAEVEEPRHHYNDDNWAHRYSDEKIVFRTTSRPARDAVLAWLAERATEMHRSGPRLQIVEPWGDLRSSPLLPRRLDTVILPAEQKKRIIEDLAWFLGAEAVHAELGLPWHRGYLLTGPPGCGKTTIARALATHFGLDLVYVPLKSVRSDLSLLRILLNCPPRSIVLLEDIDIVQATHDRGDTPPEEGMSLQGLLNGLDGVATPHGLITIATTNRPEVLDPALTRPGRLDVREEFGRLTWETFAALAAMLDAGPFSEERWATGKGFRPEWVPKDAPIPLLPALTVADVIEAAKPYLGGSQTERDAAITRLLRPR